MSPVDAEARSMAKMFAWKLNLVLSGVGATFALVVGLAVWTVQRVDTIARDVRAAAVQEARTEARDVAGEASKNTREYVDSRLADLR